MFTNLDLFDVFFLSMIAISGLACVGYGAVNLLKKSKPVQAFNAQFDMVNRVK